MMMNIVFTGPESTAKTALCTYASSYFSLPMVEEYARKYIDLLERPYRKSDLELIAQRQVQLIGRNSGEHPAQLIDTDLLTIIIWSREKYREIPGWIMDHWLQTDYHYLLCRPDLPWEYDPQRENPGDRERLFEIYLEYLEDHNKIYQCIEGSGKERENATVDMISYWLDH